MCISRKPNGEYLTGELLSIYESKNAAHFVMELGRLFLCRKRDGSMEGGQRKDFIKNKEGQMKRDKFKKMRLQLETLKPAKADDCALLLQGLTMEISETSNFSMESVEQKKREQKNGILAVEMEARGIRTDDKRLAHLKTGRQAEILDYNYFKSRMPEMVITDIQAEVFDFRKNRVVPFAVKRLEFSFGNGKKIDMTDRVSVLSLDCLAA